MKIIADLHIHSRYSRATSPRLNPPCLERWARIKGIGLIGAGDCTHPAWLEELRSQTEDAEEGFYTLKKETGDAFDAGEAALEGLPEPGDIAPNAENPRFVLTGEISTIYKKEGRTRKIHHLVVFPNFRAAAVFNARLESLGFNIRSDGRPILGIDSRHLLALLLESDERSLLIPAHIWTPWFSVLGANSGFDSIEECYGDLTAYIPAVETGLSSNPAMNWALKGLEKFSVISNSDAHSPDKLGREAVILDMSLSYASLREAFAPSPQDGRARTPRAADILGTIEFFPQEGKYHYDGHRKCGVSLEPEKAAALDFICPVCGKALTRGVMGRVLELADRPVNEEESCPPDYAGTNRRPYYSLIPLRELCAELLGTGAASKKAETAYYRLIKKGGSEFSILTEKSLGDLEKLSIPEIPGEILAAALKKMRAGEVFVNPGYDGEYGTIRVFAPGSVPGIYGTGEDKNLFGEIEETRAGQKDAPLSGRTGRKPAAVKTQKERAPADKERKDFIPDADQKKIIAHNGEKTLVIAGPGTGKTAVLGARIARLLGEGEDPASILALTFTVKAAAELRERLRKKTGTPEKGGAAQAPVTAATFHSFCCSVLREQASAAGLPPDFKILGEGERDTLLREIAGKRSRRLGDYIEERKRFLLLPGESFPKSAAEALAEAPGGALPEIPPPDSEMETLYAVYRTALKKLSSLDFEDLCSGTARLFASRPGILELYRRKFRHIFVDEYQDINFSQYILIRLLAPPGGSGLWVIGDPNQAIYGFRGSDRRFIDCFSRDYPDAECFKLSRSFRCAGPIINAAGKLTGSGLSGSPENSAGVKLFRAEYATEKAEAEGIARTIEALAGGTNFFALDSGIAGDFSLESGNVNPGDCAVLVRSAVLAAPVIKALNDHGIPFDFSGDSPWWKKEPLNSLLAILGERAKTEKGLRDAEPEAMIRAAWEDLLKSGKTKSKKGESPEPVERLIGLSKVLGDTASLLDTLDSCAASGIPEAGLSAAVNPGGPLTNDGVKIMTIHASKGLEFEYVFTAGLEEGILPFTLYDSGGGDKNGRGERKARVCEIGEERRLLYVAMTRAKRGLWLSFARSRLFRGRKLEAKPSRFLSELEAIIPLVKQEIPKKGDGQLTLF